MIRLWHACECVCSVRSCVFVHEPDSSGNGGGGGNNSNGGGGTVIRRMHACMCTLRVVRLSAPIYPVYNWLCLNACARSRANANTED